MNGIIKRTVKRIKKLLWLLILLPILSGGLSYFMASNAVAMNTATAEIELGNFQDSIITNETKQAKDLQNQEDLERLTGTKEDFSGISIEKKEPKVLKISVTKGDPEEAERLLSLVVDSFMEKSNQLYNIKEKNLKEQIESMKKNNPGADTLPEVENDLFNLRATEFQQSITIESADDNAVKRGIFGVIVGLMLNLFILAIPEIFRD